MTARYELVKDLRYIHDFLPEEMLGGWQIRYIELVRSIINGWPGVPISRLRRPEIC